MRSVLGILLACLIAGAFAPAASARVFVGGGVVLGHPYYYYPPYYGYYPYPYYPQPMPYYAQPQPYVPPPPVASDHYYEDQDSRYCREYRHTIIVDGVKRHAFGHACRQPDGSWQIID